MTDELYDKVCRLLISFIVCGTVVVTLAALGVFK